MRSDIQKYGPKIQEIQPKYDPNTVWHVGIKSVPPPITLDPDPQIHFPMWPFESTDWAGSSQVVGNTQIHFGNTRNTPQIWPIYSLVCRHQNLPLSHNLGLRSTNSLSDVAFRINTLSRVFTSGRKYRNTLWKYKKYAQIQLWVLYSVTFEPEVGIYFQKRQNLSELNFLNDGNTTQLTRVMLEEGEVDWWWWNTVRKYKKYTPNTVWYVRNTNPGDVPPQFKRL